MQDQQETEVSGVLWRPATDERGADPSLQCLQKAHPVSGRAHHPAQVIDPSPQGPIVPAPVL